MSKNLYFDDEMQTKLLAGINKVAKAVASTLGPAGRTVILQSPMGTPTITKDGVTVAKNIELSDPVENAGAELFKSIANKTNVIAGDGTSTTVVLSDAIIREGVKLLNKGCNPISIRDGINVAVNYVNGLIDNYKQEVKTKEDIARVASISANNDLEIGNLIADAIETVGKDGVITVNDSKTTETYTELVEGMQFDRSYISAYFCNNRDAMTVEYENPYILLYKGVISSTGEIMPILESAMGMNPKPIIFIADDITGDALSTLIVNNMRGTLQACAIKSPGFGEMQKATMEDLAILLGATLIDPEAGMKLQSSTVDFLGSCDSIKITATGTTIVGGHGQKELLEDRINKLRKEVESTTGYEKEKLQDRLAKLAGGIAILHIGARNEVELKEKKHRVEDAVNATRAAIAEGIIPGGGSVLARIGLDLQGNTQISVDLSDEQITKDVETGFNILINALTKPMWQIVENSGLSGDVILAQMRGAKSGIGFDANAKEWVEMIPAGIVDPVKVVKTALENAASIASLILTSSCVITEEPEEGRG